MTKPEDVAEIVLHAPLRQTIADACRWPEPDAVTALLLAATLSQAEQSAARSLAAGFITTLRARPPGPLAAMLTAYPLGTPEGQALMELAEALLRIPDAATRDALLRDKLRGRHWHAHPALRLAALAAAGPGWRAASPFIRRAALRAIGGMADMFVLGETMAAALARASQHEAHDFRYSYDMLGEAALTDEDAAHYVAAYEQAIKAARVTGTLHENDAVSVKLSALHPRYGRAQRARVMAELLPRLTALARLAKSRNIGFTIDAEEAHRLDLSLDLLTILCDDETLSGWDGLGLAVQAYQKRAPAVLDFCTDLARRSGRRLAIRLVKGAYWDWEIKQAQLAGVADYPVFTRKAHTDISYLACARKLLGAGDVVFAQFATHNALTIASILAMGEGRAYEFQCLHGMGEELYRQVMQHTGRPCRLYAPVGPHDRLLAYLSRRLLENGANASFINQLHRRHVPLAHLLRDPVEEARNSSPLFSPHPEIPLPAQLFPDRENAVGLDLADEATIARLAHDLAHDLAQSQPLSAPMPAATGTQIDASFAAAAAYHPPPPAARAACLRHAAMALAQAQPRLLALLVSEARKTIPAALGEIREAVDYCRYYAAQVQDWPAQTHVPLGTLVCISPWNFPLAIFLGQIAAAYAAGNAVLAKPAEETPAIAAFIVKLLHEAGIPHAALTLIQGDGAIGSQLIADPRIRGVAFTGGFEAARAIQQNLSRHINPGGLPVPFIAETGGVNAMIADSSALPEQLIADLLDSAFDSAGQRCSALRLLCLQRDLAPLVLPRLRAALAQWRCGPPTALSSDSGPLISMAAAKKVRVHIENLRQAGCAVTQGTAPDDPDFVPPTLIEIPDLSFLQEEIFGPVLHVLIWRRTSLPSLMRRIAAQGYGLTFGIQSRLGQWAMRLAQTSHAGNIYINRNMIGAVVGVQPFGGHGLSGTGPKAGGPLYLHRFLAQGPACRPWAGELRGPAGERNLYAQNPGRLVYCQAKTSLGRAAQAEALRAAGALAVFDPHAEFSAALLEGDAADMHALNVRLAARPGPIIPLYVLSPAALAAGGSYNPAFLAQERSISINTAAAGGNAALAALS